MFNTKNYSPQKILAMNAQGLIDAWQDMAKEIEDSKQFDPEMTECLLAPLSDPVIMMVERARTLGFELIETGQNTSSLARNFKAATEAAIGFLKDQRTADLLKASVCIRPLEEKILPKLK